MDLTLRLRFYTHPGQSIWLAGTAPLPTHTLPLNFLNRDFWQITLPLTSVAAGQPLNYSYVLRKADGTQIFDEGRERILTLANFKCAELLVIDSWNDMGFFENAFFTEPFKKVLLAENHSEFRATAPLNPTHTFRVKAPLLQKNQTLCLLGAGAALGNWQTESPILLKRIAGENYLFAQLDLRHETFPLNYKYGVYDLEKKSFAGFEDGANRILEDEIARDKHTLINDGFANLPAQFWRGAGVAIPVFSLRSEKSFGVGEFSDLKLFADWGKKVGLKLIQLLPVNDTSATKTWQDSYPYAAISAFALHPIYLNLEKVADAKNKKLLISLEPERMRLNALEALDYEAVMKIKMDFLKQIFSLQRATTFAEDEYKTFFEENKSWLLPYAAFCFLRDKFGTADFNEWPEHKHFDAQKIDALAVNNDEIIFHFFVQFHLHQQLREATAHAHGCGLVVKGDIAIGVYRHSADVWQSPELFHTEMQAGAPPDAFAAKGQNWGFPTYNWARMAADNFAWWKKRFAQMSHYFDAFRIDHILGFFRIWSSPAHAVEGILGYFVPAIPVQISEFVQRGMAFNRERFVKPLINDEVLQKFFGNESEIVKQNFLSAGSNGNYFLKPEFSTQQQVENYFSTLESRTENQRLKEGLFDLISNVILFEVENSGAREFHFRFAMEQTLSFKNLPADAQTKLRELYVDYFFRRQDEFWKREALEKLPALKRVTNMLICGEDLGLVPACVTEVMRDLGFLSLEIQRMPKKSGQEFSRPAHAPYLSVVTPSTHDMSTIRGWWTEDRALTQKFFNGELGLTGEAPREGETEIVEAVVRQHLASPAMWSIFQWQDLLGTDAQLRRANVEAERINVPANPKYYWRYRCHLMLEKLLTADDFNIHLKTLIKSFGR
jgi:4-alpha-glucanotransferase